MNDSETKGNKKDRAMEEVVHLLNEHLKQHMQYSFEVGGRTHDLSCSEDCMLASAQNLRRGTSAVLQVIRSRDDYYTEQAAAKLLALFDAYEMLSARFAEIHQTYPDSAKELMKQVPVLKTLEDHGEQVWSEVQDKI